MSSASVCFNCIVSSEKKKYQQPLVKNLRNVKLWSLVSRNNLLFYIRKHAGKCTCFNNEKSS